METKNAFLAIILSMFVIFGYQYLFPTQQAPVQPAPVNSAPVSVEATPPPVSPVFTPADPVVDQTTPSIPARDIPIETSLYRAVVSENGGTIKSFELKEYKETPGKNALDKQLIRDSESPNLPFFFSWGKDPELVIKRPIMTADQSQLSRGGTLALTGSPGPGLSITKQLSFSDNAYQIELTVDVTNKSEEALKGSPYLTVSSKPLSPEATDSRYLFSGPVALVDGSLEQVKIPDLKKEGPKTMQGQVAWTSFEDTYFMLAAAADQEEATPQTVRMTTGTAEQVNTVLSGQPDIIASGQVKQYRYTIYIGPKKMEALEQAGHDFDRAINFGWFGMVAKPVLVLLNLIYRYIHNYGVAIILVTVLIKMVFWPITHKGMKSMKDMQKLQPKLAKLKEKYKDDKERQAQEQMKLYKTYKINPLGGCLPMLLQIPVFFALYRVLMQAIELRHAPFMLWITDLSAPERLAVGFQIPYVGGLPVLTLLMGGSMFLQQKMTPQSAANPEMAKAMMFMPVIFTFLFINFASGLVLYFIVNNLLSMTQQYFINKHTG
ncbi:MAG: membrane protein insertase YidC [Proteobacteria bacterium]|nr:membrane protein insertase YidC [Pseudomonadota bacterium]MBU1687631.1 membrane protein insertase YidC [Pseudomonadota bacterium]